MYNYLVSDKLLKNLRKISKKDKIFYDKKSNTVIFDNIKHHDFVYENR